MTSNKLLACTRRMRELFQAALQKGEEVPKLEAVFDQSIQRHVKRSFPPVVLERVEALGDALEEIDEAVAEVESELDLLEFLVHGIQAMEKVDASGLAARAQEETEPSADEVPAGEGISPDRGLAGDGGGGG